MIVTYECCFHLQIYSTDTVVHLRIQLFIIQWRTALQPDSTFGSFPINFQASCKNEYASAARRIHLQDRMIMKRKCFIEKNKQKNTPHN